MAETFSPTLLTVINGQLTSAVTSINNNFNAIQTLLADVLSLSGVAPNALQADIDMNGNTLLNLPTPVNPNDPVRLQDLTGDITINSGGTSNTMEVFTTAPSSPVMGQFYFNSADLVAQVWNGSAWINFG